MLLSKAHLYEEADQLTSFYAGAITHPARLRIIRTLRENGPRTVFEIAAEHPLSLSAVSQHLEILRERGILEFKYHFPYLTYYLNYERYKEVRKLLLDFF
ncbi:MAG TPA: helix-turn-helix domain-containing protein [Saprospiraceae bacterium]|nr:helix-turn-helix domain-containing protein [Saprospiraceae bacterium]